MKRIAIIGAGGINSWFLLHLTEMLKTFDKNDITYLKIFDKDEVEEKNLKRGNQNFIINDLMEQKAEVLGKRYNVDFDINWITEENINILDNFDDVVLGVDNNKTRKLVYQYCLSHNKWLLDLRAQGTQMMFVVIDGTKPIEYYNEKYFKNTETMERKGSCQLESDVAKDHFENANKAIAFVGAYCIYLKRLREEKIMIPEFKIAY